MLVGEQPGDVEDRAGRPFVGPAGLLLRELLSDAGIAIESAYVTNAVKHFKWRPAGKRRIHDKPNWTEITACGHWLELELAAVRPELVVCLGATAAQALLGKTARVGALRGRPHPLSPATLALVTLHPSAVLRAGRAEGRATRGARCGPRARSGTPRRPSRLIVKRRGPADHETALFSTGSESPGEPAPRWRGRRPPGQTGSLPRTSRPSRDSPRHPARSTRRDHRDTRRQRRPPRRAQERP